MFVGCFPRPSPNARKELIAFFPEPGMIRNNITPARAARADPSG
jgi:hypothetical protein